MSRQVRFEVPTLPSWLQHHSKHYQDMLQRHSKQQSPHLPVLLAGTVPESLDDPTTVVAAAILEHRLDAIVAHPGKYVAWDACLAIAITHGGSDEVVSIVWRTATHSSQVMGMEIHYHHADAPVLADNDVWYSRPLSHDSSRARYVCPNSDDSTIPCDTVVEYVS